MEFHAKHTYSWHSAQQDKRWGDLGAAKKQPGALTKAYQEEMIARKGAESQTVLQCLNTWLGTQDIISNAGRKELRSHYSRGQKEPDVPLLMSSFVESESTGLFETSLPSFYPLITEPAGVR